MGYRIYYKNNIRGGGNSTHGRFEQYDRKTYPTKAAAERALAAYNKKFRVLHTRMKKEGYKETYQIRSVGETKKPRSTGLWGF